MIMTSSSLPKTSPLLDLSYPTKGKNILLVTLSRPEKYNAIPSHGHTEMATIWEWMDQQPEIRCGVLTGRGKAFCAGADLSGRSSDHGLFPETMNISPSLTEKLTLYPEWVTNPNRAPLPVSGFGGLSRRQGKKPIIAAVNGLCFGGGFEMVINTDLVVAGPSARFQLPEAQVGVAVLAGALPRLVCTVGKQRATELAITGRTLSAMEAQDWGLVNEVVEDNDNLLSKAVAMAEKVVRSSPDSVIIHRAAIARGWEGNVAEGDRVMDQLWARAVEGQNLTSGLRAWSKRTRPEWVASKL